MFIALCLLVAALCLLTQLPRLLDLWRAPLSDKQRNAASGQFALLSRGRTHFRWYGEKDRPLVVCVHGLTYCSEGFCDLAQALTRRGFRVLTYDLYDRGLSDSSNTEQTADLFNEQLEELLAHEGIVDGLNLLGHSAGCCFAMNFALKHPSRIRHVALLTPVRLHVPRGAMATVLRGRTPMDYWLHSLTFPTIAHRFTRNHFDRRNTPPLVEQARERSENRRGFYLANFSAMQRVLRQDYPSILQELNKLDLPVTAIWGGADKIVPKEAQMQMAQSHPRAKQFELEAAQHSLPFTHADVAAGVLAQQFSAGQKLHAAQEAAQ